MFLKEIEIENFGIIREAHLAFPRSNPVLGLVGKYEAEEDSGRSNRSGKSTFVEANEYLLFGRARTRHHGKLINRTARAAGEGMKVRGVYELQDGREIEITRVRTNDGKGTASVTGFEGAGWAEVNGAIEELIGFTHDEYKNTACFSQGDIHSFMRSGPKEKRLLLLEWLNQTRWEVRADFAKQQAGEAETKIKSLTGTLDALPESEETPEELEEQAQEASDASKIVVAERDEEKKKLEVLEEEYKAAADQANLRTRKKYITQHVKETEAALEEAEGNARKKRTLEESAGIERKMLRERQGERSEELNALRENLRVVQNAGQQALGRLNAAKAASGTCPVLDEPCNRIEPGQVRELARLADETGLAYTEAKEGSERVKARYSEDIQELENDLGNIERELRKLGNTDAERLEKKLDELDGELDEVNSGLEEMVRTPTDISYDKTELTERVEALNRQIGKHSAQAVSLRREADRAQSYIERRARIEASLEEARVDLGTWQYCAFMFGDRGIPNEFIKGAFDTLEKDINYILGRMNCGLSIEFKPYRETKNFEPSCLACGSEFEPRQRKCSICKEPRQKKRVEQLVLIIHDAAEGTESDFSLDSGGGQTLISFAVRLALLFFKVRQGSGETPPVILDEIAGMLDPINRNAVIDVVLHILTEEYGIDQVFWISHNPDIIDMIEHTIAVTRTGTASTVNWM